jgi:hypothetical protein
VSDKSVPVHSPKQHERLHALHEIDQSARVTVAGAPANWSAIGHAPSIDLQEISMRHQMAFGAACAAILVAANLAFADGMTNTNTMGTTNGSAMTGGSMSATNTNKPQHHKKKHDTHMNGGSMSGGAMSGGSMSGGSMSGSAMSGGQTPPANNAMGTGH